MNIRNLLNRIGAPATVSLVAVFVFALIATAGSLTPSALPSATMASLSDIWNSIASATYDSSAIVANQNGSLLSTLKYIEQNTVWASASNNAYYLGSGNVGIGTTSPDAKFELVGTASISGVMRIDGAGSRNTLFLSGTGNASVYTELWFMPTVASTSTGTPWGFGWSVRKDAYYGGDASGPSMVMEIGRVGGGVYVPIIIQPTGNLILAGSSNATNGNVGVGTRFPTTKLDVSGSASVSGNFELAGYISSNWLSRLDSAYTLGDSTHRWANLFAVNASISNMLEADIASVSQLFVGGSIFSGQGITSDSLDFDELVDAMTLDTNTTVAMAGNTYAFTGAGNIGIGTTNTAGKLHVVPEAAGASLFLDKYDNTNGGEMTLDGNTKTWHLGEALGLFKIMRYGANNGLFESNDFSITTVGNVGIGTTTADTKLEVAGAASASAFFGAGLTECTNDTTEKLLWNSSTGRFSCGVDQSGVSLTGWQLGGSIVQLYNSTDQVGIGTANLNSGIKLEVAGTASLSGGLYMGLPTGNLGVGTTGPGARIEVAAGGAANGLLISGASTNGLRITTSNNANNSIFNVTNSANNTSWLTVNANGQVIMNGTGNVGIGNTSPDTKLDVAGTASVSSLLVAQFASVSGNLEVAGYASASRTFGSGLADCDLSSSKLLWDDVTGQFSCGVDQTSSGGASIGTSSDLTAFTNVSSLSFAVAHFNLSYPAGGLVTLNWGAGGPASLSQDETVSGWWTFGNNVSVSGGLEVVGILKGAATTLSSLTVNGQSSAVNASVSGIFETATLKATTLSNSTGTLTINAHTLGGLVIGNGQNITGLNQITTSIGSVSGTFEALTFKATTLGADGVLSLSPTTRLQISGNASISNNFEIIGVASSSAYYGAGLTSCIGGSQKLLWENGQFSCGVDQSGSGGGALIGFREGFTGGFNNFSSISFDAGKFALDTSNADIRLNLVWGAGGPASLSQDETVIGHWVFTNHASVTGDFELTNRLKTVFASISNALEISGYASASQYFGGGLSDCDDATSKLVWTASGSNAGRFSCGVDQSGGSSGWSADPGYIYLTTNTDNVGIGTSTPVQPLQIKTTGAGALEYAAMLQNSSNTVGRTTGLLFSVEGTNNNGKGALVFTRTGSFGVGDFHFLQNTTADTSNAAIGQEVLTIKSNGNVGIGSTAPSRLLDVDGAFEANSTFGSGLSTCSNGVTDKLLYNSTTGLFSCGTDQSGSSAAGWQDNGATVTLFTDTDNVGLGTQNVSGAKLEVAGIASISNLIVPNGYASIGTTATGTARLFAQGVVSGGVNQPVFAVASASGRVTFAVNENGSVIIGHDSLYGENFWNERFNQINRDPGNNNPTRTEMNASDDLFIAGDLEIDGIVDFGSNASISGDVEMAPGSVLYLATYDVYPDLSYPVLAFSGDPDTGISHDGLNGPNKIFFVNQGTTSGLFDNEGNFVLKNGVAYLSSGNAKLDVFGTAGANDVIRLSSSSGALGFVMGPNRALVIGGGTYRLGDNFQQFNTDTVNQNQNRSEISALDDVFISGDLEIDGILDIQDEASVGGAFEVTSGYLKIPNGSVALPTLRFQNYPTTGLSAPATDVLAFSTAGVERMRISATGNVGIAETAPAAKLEVNGDVIFSDVLQAGGTATVSYSRFGTGTTSHAITGNGSVFLSTDLEVNGMSWLDGSASIAGTFELAAGTAALPSLKFTDNEGLFDAGTNILGFTTAGTEAMRIDASNNIGIGTTTTSGGRLSIMGGNVGIGTTTTTAKFTLRGQAGDTAPLVSIGSLSVEALNIGKNTNVWLNPTNLGNTGIGVDVGTAPDGQLNVRAINAIVGDEKLFTIDNSSGTDYFSVADSGASLSVSLELGAGSAANPSLKFADNEGLFDAGTNILGFTTAGTERMRIDASGNVGIGTTTANSRLTVRGTSAFGIPGTTVARNPISVIDANNYTIDIGQGYADTATAPTTIASGSYLQLGQQEYGANSYRLITFGWKGSVDTYHPAYLGYEEESAVGKTYGDLIFGTRGTGTDVAPTERMRISGSGNISIGTTTTSGAKLSVMGGNVGIGTTTAGALLDVTGDVILRETLQVAGTATVSYSRFGTGTATNTTQLNAGNDLFITDALEVDGKTFLDGTTSISGQLELGAGSAALPSLKFADNQGLFSVATNILGFSTAGTERMRIDAAGNVGIGTTTTPTQRLQVNATADTGAGMLVTSNTAWAAGKDVSIFLGDTGHYIRGVYSSADVWSSYYGQQFANNSGTVMTVGANSTANVGIGTTGPVAKLNVSGNVVIDSLDVSYGEGLRVNNAANGYSGIHLGGAAGSNSGTGTGLWHIVRTGDGTTSFQIMENTTAMLVIRPTTGNVGIGTTAPSTRLEVSGGGLKVSDEIIGGGALQMAGTATVSYSRFGTVATTHSLSASNDLLINGKLEVDGVAFFDTAASVSTTLEIGNGITGNTPIPLIISTARTYGALPTAGATSLVISDSSANASQRILFKGYQGIDVAAIDQIDVGSSTSALTFWTPTTANALSEKMRIMPSGNVGIATTAPLARLDVNGDVIFRDLIQAGGTATASYSRFGTGTTGHSLTGSSDVLISDDLEVNGVLYADGGINGATQSISNLTNITGTGTSQFGSSLTDNGTAGAPSFAFTNKTNTGMYLSNAGSGYIGFSANGVLVASVRSDGLYAESGYDVVTGNIFRVGATSGISVGPCSSAQYLGNGVQVVGGIITAGSCRSDDIGTTDIAEKFFKMDELIEPGMLVTAYASGGLNFDKLGTLSFYQQGVVRSAGEYQSGVIGVVSTHPGIVMGVGLASGTNQEAVDVALAGRVPVRVTTANGPIRVGDRIVSSNVPGVGMKATRAGMTVGIALEPTEEGLASDSFGSVIVLMSPAYWAPSLEDATTGVVLDLREVHPGLFETFTATLRSALNISLEQGVVRTVTGWFTEVRAEKLCLDDVCITKDQLQRILDRDVPPPLPSAPAPALGPDTQMFTGAPTSATGDSGNIPPDVTASSSTGQIEAPATP